MAKSKVDILNGPLISSIIRYAIPLLFVGLIQNLFNAVDIMVLRAMAGSDTAVASVGAASSIIHLLVTSFFGLSNGTRIVLARLLGAKEEKDARKTVSTAILTALILGIIVAIAGISCTEWFLQLTRCPSDCYEGARIYMWIYLSAAPAILLYNFGSSVINTTGDSKNPLYYMMISGILNVLMNFLFCIVLKEKVAAVAIATALSQLAGALLVLRHLIRLDGPCRLDLHRLLLDLPILGKLLRYGLPLALTQALYPLANLQIQTAVNSFGSAAMAGNAAMASLETLASTIAISPWASATTVFVGQNLGAGNRHRVTKSTLCTLAISSALGIFLGITGTIFSRALLKLYVTEELAIQFAQVRMMSTLLFVGINALNNVLSHYIQAFGYTVFCSVNSVVSVLLFRVFWMQLLYPRFLEQGLDNFANYGFITRCFLVSWCLVLVVNFCFSAYLYFAKFRKGSLKQTL